MKSPQHGARRRFAVKKWLRRWDCGVVGAKQQLPSAIKVVHWQRRNRCGARLELSHAVKTTPNPRQREKRSISEDLGSVDLLEESNRFYGRFCAVSKLPFHEDDRRSGRKRPREAEWGMNRHGTIVGSFRAVRRSRSGACEELQSNINECPLKQPSRPVSGWKKTLRPIPCRFALARQTSGL